MPWRLLLDLDRIGGDLNVALDQSHLTPRRARHIAKPIRVIQLTAGKCAPMQVFRPERGRFTTAEACLLSDELLCFIYFALTFLPAVGLELWPFGELLRI